MLKKFTCLVLMLWLPFFMTAASAMGMQMSLEAIHATSDTHAHCHKSAHQVTSSQFTANQVTSAGNQMAETLPANKPLTSPHSHCTTCGFCVISHVITNQTVSFASTHPKTAHFMAPAISFSSLDYPPAIKPPISH